MIITALRTILVGLLLIHPLVVAAKDKPNILWIFIDDQGPEWGCYGNPLVHTPALDQLANGGTRYTKAFAVAPVCSVSHTSLFTGNYVTTLGVPHHRSHYQDDLPPGYFHAEELLSKAGYFTVNMVSSGGKQDKIIYGASGKTDFNFYRKSPDHKKKRINNQSGAEFFDHVHQFGNMELQSYFQGGIWKQRKKGQPFFAFMNIETGKKHGWEEANQWAQDQNKQVNPEKVRVPPYLADTPEIRAFLTSKLNAVSHTDAVISRILKALKQSGEYDKTFIFIASDHGYDFMRNKQTLYDSGLRVPMIIKWPGKSQPRKCDELVGLIDVAPTSLALAGVTPPDTMEGIKLSSKEALRNRPYLFGTRDGVDGFFDMYRTVRNKRFRYIKHFYPEISYVNGTYASRYLVLKEMRELYKQGKLTPVQKAFMLPEKSSAEELYDLENDPDEIHNLAANPEYAGIKKELAESLETWMQSTGDRDPQYRKLSNKEKLKSGVRVGTLLKLIPAPESTDQPQ